MLRPCDRKVDGDEADAEPPVPIGRRGASWAHLRLRRLRWVAVFEIGRGLRSGEQPLGDDPVDAGEAVAGVAGVELRETVCDWYAIILRVFWAHFAARVFCLILLLIFVGRYLL